MSATTDRGHRGCLLCGSDNPRSLGLMFQDSSRGGVEAEFQGGDELQGYDGLMHGGVIASLLDAAMTHCLFHRGVRAVTGDLNVRYLQPVPCRARLRILAHLVSRDRKSVV